MFKNFGFFLGLFLLVSSSCSKYNKVLKSDDLAYKYTKAIEYYNEKEYIKCIPIFEELITLYRGTAKSESVYYYYSMAHFGLKDYYLASYYLKNFVKTYPNSQYSEDCAFLSAYCSYLSSPNYELDQAETKTAVSEMQLFLDRYPESSKKDSCNNIIDELREKLAEKSFQNAKLYYQTENYKSAVVTLNNTIKDYPNSKHIEELHFLIVKSNFLLAVNSIQSKKAERFKETIKSYTTFADLFVNSKYIKQAENFYDSSIKELEKLKNTN
jgi:outer membrane protein assembly factor BamD